MDVIPRYRATRDRQLGATLAAARVAREGVELTRRGALRTRAPPSVERRAAHGRGGCNSCLENAAVEHHAAFETAPTCRLHCYRSTSGEVRIAIEIIPQDEYQLNNAICPCNALLKLKCITLARNPTMCHGATAQRVPRRPHPPEPKERNAKKNPAAKKTAPAKRPPAAGAAAGAAATKKPRAALARGGASPPPAAAAAAATAPA